MIEDNQILLYVASYKDIAPGIPTWTREINVIATSLDQAIDTFHANREKTWNLTAIREDDKKIILAGSIPAILTNLVSNYYERE